MDGVLGDRIGRYTCRKYNGRSLLDYLLTDNNTLSQLRYFNVSLMGDLSDHCIISFEIAVTITLPQA